MDSCQLWRFGYEVIASGNTKSDIITVLANAFKIKDRGTFNKKIVEFYSKYRYDEDICTTVGINTDDSYAIKIADFSIREGYNCDYKLACLAAARLFKTNIKVYHGSAVEQVFSRPVIEGGPYQRTICLSKQDDLKFYLLRSLNPVEIENRKIAEDKRLWQYLKDEGYTIIGMPGDGHCMYRAIAYWRGQTNPLTVRKEIADYVKENLNSLWAVLYFTGKSKEKQEEKIEKIRSDKNEWGDSLTLNAAYRLYQINIKVYNGPNNAIHYPNDFDLTRKTLELSYHFGNHYNLLERIVTNENNYDTNLNSSFISDVSDSNLGEEGITHLLQRLEFESLSYVLSKVFKEGRQQLNIYLLLYGISNAETIQEVLKENLTKTFYLLVDDQNCAKQILEDEEMRDCFTVWRTTIDLPWYGASNDRFVWLSHLMVLPLLLSTVRVKWNGYDIRVLFKRGRKGMMFSLLSNLWGVVRDTIKDTANLIHDNSHILFCMKCKNNCIYKSEAWHYDLSKFQRVYFENPANYGFLDRFSFFDTRNDVASVPSILTTLKQMYWSKNEDLNEVVEKLDENYNVENKNKWFSSYLMLIMDGPNMDKYRYLEKYDLLKKKDVYKLLYAGSTTNAWFRRSHFQDKKSSIAKYLTNRSRIFFIRKKCFKDIRACKRDEAMVIEILKTNFMSYKQKRKEAPYYYINRVSEAKALIRANEKMIENISLFAGFEVPIFSLDGTRDKCYVNHYFQGNYIVGDEVDVDFIDNIFADVENEYDDLKYLR